MNLQSDVTCEHRRLRKEDADYPFIALKPVVKNECFTEIISNLTHLHHLGIPLSTKLCWRSFSVIVPIPRTVANVHLRVP